MSRIVRLPRGENKLGLWVNMDRITHIEEVFSQFAGGLVLSIYFGQMNSCLTLQGAEREAMLMLLDGEELDK